MLAIFSFSECLGLRASILKWHVCSSSQLGNCAKMQKKTSFLTRNPYRPWSFQLGAQNMSKIGSFSENIVFYVTKLNHSVLRHSPGARMLILPFSCSIVVNCIKVVELSTGIFYVKKIMELRTQNAQLIVDPMETLESSDLKSSIGARSAHCLGSKTLNAPILTSLWKNTEVCVELWFKNAFCPKSRSSMLIDALCWSSSSKVTFPLELMI